MKPPIHLPRRPGRIGGFQAFVLRGNVVDLAIGIIVGAAFTLKTARPQDAARPQLLS